MIAWILASAAIAIAASWLLERLTRDLRPMTDWERYCFSGGSDQCSWCGARLIANTGGGWVTLFCPQQGHDYFRFREDEP
jgi:hypothetical protein